MSNKKATKDKLGRPSTGENVKSRGKNGITDITRKITGLDDHDSGFGATRKSVERTIKDIRNVSDIPKKISLDEKNFEEFSELINKIITNDNLKEANNRITKPNKEASLDDYDIIIEAMLDIINEREDNNYEKKILNRHVNNSYEEIKIIKQIKEEVDGIFAGLCRASETMRVESYTECFLDIRDKLNGIKNDLNNNVEMYKVMQERIIKASEKYPEVKELDEINLNDFDSLNIDFIGEVLGLPTIKEMQNIINKDIESGKIEADK
jgi:hypothetical protein